MTRRRSATNYTSCPLLDKYCGYCRQHGHRGNVYRTDTYCIGEAIAKLRQYTIELQYHRERLL